MHYTIYKITNLIDNKIYIGKHQTKNLNDGYMGSGKLVIEAIQKYGIENFTKETLFNFDNESDMNAKEAELVTKDFVKEDTNYNLCPGGHGGWGYINLSGLKKFRGMTHSEESRNKMGHKGNSFRKGKKISDETKKMLSIIMSEKLKGKPKSEEHKKKLSESLKANEKLKGRKFPNRKKREPISFEVVICPHCNKSGKKNAMKRWHFDNCKTRV